MTRPCVEGSGEIGRQAPVSRQRVKLLMILLVCAAPVIASYLAYYVLPPSGRTNYGTLIEPQRPVPQLELTTLDGTPFAIVSLSGQWVMLQADSGACDQVCRDKQLMLRQQRTITGRDRERIDRLWLITDQAPVDAELARSEAGSHIVRADRAELQRLLPVADGGRLEDHIWLVDPMGNLMMRYPRDPDPNGLKRDIGRLLRADGRRPLGLRAQDTGG